MSMLLQAWPAEQAARRPRAPALVYQTQAWSYAELEARSNQVASVLKKAGVGPGDRVVLLAPKNPWTIAALLGVLKADAVYVPLDPASPAPRLSRMLEASECRWVLTGPGGGSALGELLGDPIGNRLQLGWLGPDAAPEAMGSAVGFQLSDVQAASDAPHRWTNAPDAVAHLLFTSGSTGVPKGVMVTHASVRAFVTWAVDYFGTAAADRISGHPPLHFDLSTFDLFGTFAAGATLYPVPVQLNLLAAKLASFIRDTEVTQWFSVPSVLTYLSANDVVRQGDFPSLRRLLWCGEVLPTPTLRYWMERLPSVTFTNLYGPTEATIASSYYTVPARPDDDRDPIPIGRPCDGEVLYVLDEEYRAVPPGVVGNLFIGGVGLSPGYWRDPDKTAKAFLVPEVGPAAEQRIYRTGDLARWGEDGLVYFLGRADTQIKSRGYRIELGEIEAALHSLAGLDESAVVAVPSQGFEGYTICCAFVPSADSAVTAQTLRQCLTALLPSYMLPSRWHAFPSLPKNANGKIDRPALREEFADQVSTP